MKGTLLVAVVQGGLGGVLFSLVGIQAAVFWGVMMGILSLLRRDAGRPHRVRLAGFVAGPIVAALFLVMWDMFAEENASPVRALRWVPPVLEQESLAGEAASAHNRARGRQSRPDEWLGSISRP